MKFFLTFLLLFSLVPARAETVRLGDTDLPYSPPAGFVRADGLFAVDLADLDKEFGLHTVIFTKYIPVADAPIREKNGRAIPSWYSHLTYDDKYSRYALGETVFGLISHFVGKAVASQYDKPAFIHQLEAVVSGVLKRKIVIASMTPKGFVEKKPGLYSMLAYGHGQVETDGGGTENFAMANMTTFYLARGRFVTIVQGSRIRSEAGVPAFTQKALRIAAEISHQGQ
ncbi:MAG: hypothetical protein LBT71_06070 [Azoarcus sp.]|jgi:hypothetical protein|nr:hypothetical protein [Azoarcus sp.]